ncbi:hypothetical protein OSB04_022717 [Centaurea solstitialis]|uniref:F-box domain-containing protein n=1 Tax=Centaurea solstitialis TaxID=347529 RepID=A0AA38SV82_9ASTR|nr:hypothetical protein OSB04_022717 [Centaurea solstitialis]
MANRKKITLPELSPEIVLFHILPKLPGKSLLRFKCVCKQWQSFLTTPLFANIHLHHVTNVDRSRHEKVIILRNRFTSFETIDCEDALLCYPFGGYNLIFVSSVTVNGLVCLGIEQRNTNEVFDFDIILWNPLTGEYKTLPKPSGVYQYNMFELYYTCSDDDYKILSINNHGNVYIYSLRSDSWRMLESRVEDHIPYVAAGDHNLLDGKLHFLRDLAQKEGESPGWLSRTWIIEMWRMNGDGGWTNMVNISYTHYDNRIRPLHLMRNGNLIMRTEKDDCSEICKVDPQKNTVDVLCSRPKMDFTPMYIETFVSPNQYGVN